eukprot:1571643-Rhodomonas_salina.2
MRQSGKGKGTRDIERKDRVGCERMKQRREGETGHYLRVHANRLECPRQFRDSLVFGVNIHGAKSQRSASRSQGNSRSKWFCLHSESTVALARSREKCWKSHLHARGQNESVMFVFGDLCGLSR